MNGMLCSGNTLQLPAGHSYNRLYILAAAATAEEDVRGVFQAGKNLQEIVVPSYTGFIGQWGHTGHTQGYLKDAEVAYVGTHRHSAEGDHAYEFTYMFKFAIDIPAKATEVILPDNKDIVILLLHWLKNHMHLLKHYLLYSRLPMKMIPACRRQQN